MEGEQYVDENGDIWIKYKDDTSQNEIDVNKSELEKEGLKTDIEINNTENEGNIEINENQNK
ncbi:MAG: hypothetical protein ACLTAI_03255 [Thomasclavelia sp.]